jgi:hypothetical protein
VLGGALPCPGSDRVQPFAEKQVELVTTFGDQALIAIEKVAIQRKTVALLGMPASLQMRRRVLPSASRAQIDMAT